MAMVFCRGCGKEIHESAPTCPHCGAPQGQEAQANSLETIPEGVKGWSWGAFFLNWIWAIGNKTWIGLLALVPYIGFIMAIVLGIKGREWAWRNKKWDSLEHFNRVQKLWSTWAVGLVLGVGGLGIIAAIAIPQYISYKEKAKIVESQRIEQEAAIKRQAAEAELLARQQEEARKRQADDELQARLREAEEKGRREAEEKARQAAQASGNVPQPVAVAGSLIDKAARCENLQTCMRIMIDSADPRSPESIQVAAARIGEFNKAQRGDRKADRDLNKRGLDEFRNNNFPVAINLLTQAAAADNADVEIHSNLGFVAIRANRPDVAGQALAAALLLDPRRTSTWLPVAEFFSLKGNNESSVRSLLLGYEFSTNKEKTLAFFEDKSTTAEREAMRPVYTAALQRIRQAPR